MRIRMRQTLLDPTSNVNTTTARRHGPHIHNSYLRQVYKSAASIVYLYSTHLGWDHDGDYTLSKYASMVLVILTHLWLAEVCEWARYLWVEPTSDKCIVFVIQPIVNVLMSDVLLWYNGRSRMLRIHTVLIQQVYKSSNLYQKAKTFGWYIISPL